MAVESWEELDVAVKRMIDDPTYRQWRPLIDKLQPLVGARVNIDTAKGLLSVIEAIHGGKIELGAVIDELGKKGGAFAQPNWQVDTVIQIVVNTLPQLRTAAPVIPVPIVLVVMTGTEAAALAACQPFTERHTFLRNDFQALQDDLTTNNLAGWVSQYGLRPEDWHPFGAAQTIEERAVAALAEFTDTLGLEKRLVPRFIDIRTLQNNRAHILRLRRDGCIVVLDTISLRHPTLLFAFQRTLLDAYPTTSVVTMMPHHNLAQRTRGLTYSLQLSMSDSELSKRLLDVGEFGVCTDAFAIDQFPPWLQTRVKQICGKAIAEGGIRAEMNA